MTTLRMTRSESARELAVDFEVDDIVLCKVRVKGLEVGRVYPVYAVYRRRVWNEIWTTITVNADFVLVDVSPAEPALRRTQLQATTRAPDGRETTHLFADAVELDEWCARNGMPRECLHGLRYIEMAIVVPVPGPGAP